MSLRPTHVGYGYQDLLTAIRLVDVVLGRAASAVVDTKSFDGDRFDDLTTLWRSGEQERLQIKHTGEDRALSASSFTGERRGLRLDHVLGSVTEDLSRDPATSHRLLLRDLPPDDHDLAQVLVPVDPRRDPGPALAGLSSTRMRFDAPALRAANRWRSSVAGFDDDVLDRACDVFVVECGMPGCSLDVRAPGAAEEALLRRIADELGAGRPPNRDRSPQDVALALIDAAKSARSLDGHVTAHDLRPRLDLAVDFGAVPQGHPVDPAREITRPAVLDRLVDTVMTAAGEKTTVLVTAGPGSGKSWLCEQLADRMRTHSVVARHHCWLGGSDPALQQRVLDEVVVGSLLAQLQEAAPGIVDDLRPRYAATPENLQRALDAVRSADPDMPIVLIVDGLDHVTRILGGTEGAAFGTPADPATVLVERLAEVQLPDGVALVLASQPGEHLRALQDRGTHWALPSLTLPEVHQLAEKTGVRAAFPRTPDGVEAGRADIAAEIIHDRSRGNALYATYLCRQAVGPAPALHVEAGPDVTVDPLDRLRDVPESAGDLDAYYDYLLRGLTEAQRYVVGLLAVCDFAVTADELGEIFPIAGPLLSGALAAAAPIVVQQPGLGGLKVHHESFSRFVRATLGDAALGEIRRGAAAWLTSRGFHSDARAFRHLPELLIALDQGEEVTALITPDFLSRAVAGLQPPQAVAHALELLGHHSAARREWPALVRLVQLRNAADRYDSDGLPQELADHADVLLALAGADAVAAALVYDGRATMTPRVGLQLCAATDQAGVAAPWKVYLDAWDDVRTAEPSMGSGRNDDLDLALLRGRLRVRRAGPGVQGTSGNADRDDAVRLAGQLARDDLPPLADLLDVFLDCLGPALVLAGARLLTRPERRAAALLHLADVAADAGAGGSLELPAPSDLAAEAFTASSTADPLRLLRHGVPIAALADAVLGADVDAALREATTAVLQESSADRPDVVGHWLALIAVAHEVDAEAPTRLLPALSGDGFYRAWLRFAVATVGLGRDVAVGSLPSSAASRAARAAVERLAESAEPFLGRPSASDLLRLHRHVHFVVEDAVALLDAADLEPAVAALAAISNRTTTTLSLGTPPAGPLVTPDLVALLGRSVEPAHVGVVHRVTGGLRHKEIESGTPYPQLAEFELEMARVSLTAGGIDEAWACWRRAARYLTSYGSHKDATIYELLDAIPDLFAVDPVKARHRLARLHRLTHLVRVHTNGRGTSGVIADWWRHLSDLDPAAAAERAAAILLSDPGLEDAHADAVHHRLLDRLIPEADPVITATLRVAAGSGGRDTEADTALMTRLAELPDDDCARTSSVLAVLADTICATYDDQPLEYVVDGPESAMFRALGDAAHRLGGCGLAPRPPEADPRRHPGPARRESLPQFLHARQRPDLAQGTAGALHAVRDHAGKRYDHDRAAPRWARDGLTNAVGWRLLQSADLDGAEASIGLLDRVVAEFGVLSDTTVLADIAVGLDIRRSGGSKALARLAAAAYTCAFTTIRGGGGWRTFAGERTDLWRRGFILDADVSTTLLARQVGAALWGRRERTHGITQALIAAFATRSPELGDMSPDIAFACWDAAADVIEHRLPGSAAPDAAEVYDPDADAPASDIDTLLARLAVSTLAMPDRADRRRALLAASVLLRARPQQAQAALAHVLGADLGAAALSWLLSVVADHVGVHGLADDLAERLTRLAGSEMLAVRALAGRVLTEAGRSAPDPPATSAHPALQQAVRFESAARSSEDPDDSDAADIVGELVGERLDLSDARLRGVRSATVAFAATALATPAIGRLTGLQIERLTHPSSAARPDAYLADEAAVDDALQLAAAGTRSAMAQAGHLVDPRLFERQLERELGDHPEYAIRAECARVSRPTTRPRPLRWSIPPVPWVEDIRNDSSWPPAGLRELSDAEELPGGPAALARLEDGPYADWVQIALVERQRTLAQQYPARPRRSVRIAVGVELSARPHPSGSLPFGSAIVDLWSVRWRDLDQNLDPARALDLLRTRDQPVVGVAERPRRASGAGEPPLSLAPRFPLVVALGLEPTPGHLGLSLADRQGPGLVGRRWRGHPVHDGHYEPVFPAVEGGDLLLRPDLFEQLAALAGTKRLRVGSTIGYDPIGDGPSPPDP